MRNFVSFCVAVAVALSAVPAMAQCSSCGGAPAFSQPIMNSYVPQATYSAPISQPIYNSVPMSQPVYNSVPMGQQVYNSVPMSQPVYNAPISQPIYNAAPMGQQVYSSPVSVPMSSGCTSCGGCSGCGGQIVGGGQIIGGGEIVGGGQIIDGGFSGGQIIDGGFSGGQIIDGGFAGGQIIDGGFNGGIVGQNVIWEGGTEIQGTIVSDVVVEGGEVSSEPTAGDNAVDVVEPPAAAPEESPGPDTDDESTEGET